MIKNGIHGFCMALADSVPGVSGGTIAFIMGFYDQFIGSIHALAFGNINQKKIALSYLIKLGIGWSIGMILAVIILSSLFENQIYIISSLFIGFIAASIPLIIKEENNSIKTATNGFLFLLLGCLVVVSITWLNGTSLIQSMDLSQFSLPLGIQLFFIGMIAISAMFLPGISGSTLLLIFGAYIPVISAIRKLLTLNFSYLPSLFFFGMGILAGAITVVKIIRICLEKYRSQTVYMILGMMIGSFYAIIQGPTTLDIPKAAMNLSSFHPLFCLIGILLVAGLQLLKERGK